MKIYSLLDKVPILSKSFVLKVLAVTFIGIHIPLLGVIFMRIFLNDEILANPTQLFFAVFALTLLATTVTLFVLRNLLKPIEQMKKLCSDYILGGKIPTEEIRYKDEMGDLMSNIQIAIHHVEHMQHLKEDYLSLFSHDVKNSFSEILSSIHLLNNNIKIEGLDLNQNIHDIINNQINSLNETIQIIKSRHAIEKVGDSTYLVSVAKVVDEVMNQFLPLARKKNIELQVENKCEGLKTPYVTVRKVLINLLSNAIKFTPLNGVIKVELEKVDDKLYLSITDTGIGFDPEGKEKLFEFNAGDNEHQSSGIGLYLTRRLVEYQNGSINAFSNGIGEGAKFEVMLPV